ncbi:MAG: LytTR family transcriptional regulator DNA-binding domain-containing protein [Sphingosinicella sp.]|nr:LytTR family transcriptional regulator DNA-binding domain-containing protein [Sphingosinicella sp.]
MAVMLAVGIALAAIGPFGSFGLGSFATRLAYWLPAAVAGYLFVRPTLILATFVGHKLHISEPPVIGAGVLLASIPMTSFILWLNGNPLVYFPSFEGWFQIYVQVGLIGGLVTLLFWLLERRTRKDVSAAVFEAPAPTARVSPASIFLSRLPPHLRGQLIALEMEDHYVRAHTILGSGLILMRMRDAVSEVTDIEGMQVHRSWWVARGAVEKAHLSGRTLKLTLTGGLEASVARSSVRALREAGWLSPFFLGNVRLPR